jgi:hypothetical protein
VDAFCGAIEDDVIANLATDLSAATHLRTAPIYFQVFYHAFEVAVISRAALLRRCKQSIV